MHKRASTKHAQSAFEYLITYGWALLILAVVLIILFYFTTVPSKVVPNTCQFATGAYCEDMVLGTVASTHATVVAFIATNLRKYPIMNPTITVEQNGVNSTPAACSPNFVLPGGAIFCELNTSAKSNPYQFIAASLYVSAVYCGFSATPGTPAGCANGGVKEVYSGSFAGTTQPISSSSSLLSVSLSANRTVQPANNSHDGLYATVRLLGYPVTGASVGFNATYTSNGTDAVPPYSLSRGFAATNATGAAIDSIWGAVPGNITVTASYGSHSAQVKIKFIPSVAVQFVPSNNLIVQFSNCTTPIVSVGGLNYTLSEIRATTFNWTIGTTHSFAFVNPFCGQSGSTIRAFFQNVTVYGVTQPATTGNVTATTSTKIPFSYRAQYYLTTAANPSTSGTVSPVSGWYNASAKVTISETSINSSTVRAQFINWTCTGTGCYSGASATATITIAAPITETANYRTLYYFSESANPASEGTVSPGSGWYIAGSTITISETPTTSTPFYEWTCTGTGCYQGTSQSATITINNPITEVANYPVYLYCPQISMPVSNSYAYAHSSAYTLLLNGVGGWAGTTSYPDNINISYPDNIYSSYYGTSASSCISSSGYVYCVGGWVYVESCDYYSCVPVPSSVNNVYYAPLSSQGIGGWTQTNSYPAPPNTTESCASSNGYIYCMGLRTTTVATNCTTTYSNFYSGVRTVTSPCTVALNVPASYYARLSSSGVSGWIQTTPYPFNPSPIFCVTQNGYVYCQEGGSNSSFYFAPISSSGIGRWERTANYPIINITGNSCATSNGYIYCVGGEQLICSVAGYSYSGAPINSCTYYSVSQAYYAKLSSSGIGGWTQTTSYPINNDAYGSCNISNGYIYCVDGAVTNGQQYCYTTSSGFHNTFASETTYCDPYYSPAVFYAPVSSGGIGAWAEGPYYYPESRTSGLASSTCVISPNGS